MPISAGSPYVVQPYDLLRIRTQGLFWPGFAYAYPSETLTQLTRVRTIHRATSVVVSLCLCRYSLGSFFELKYTPRELIKTKWQQMTLRVATSLTEFAIEFV
jgi:hypothetical protein